MSPVAHFGLNWWSLMIAAGIAVAVFACAREFDVLWRYGLWSMDLGTHALQSMDCRVWTYRCMDPRVLQM